MNGAAARDGARALVGLALCVVLVPAVAGAQRGRRARPEPAAEPAAVAAEQNATAPAAPATSAPSSAQPTAADRQAAGQSYDRATAAYLARDYPRAATLFETAYRLAPASAPLLQAVRAHERAGNTLRAATLALRLQAFYGGEEAARRQAETTLAASSAQFVRIDVTCATPCTMELDGQLQEHSSFFASPLAAHTVRASFETGSVERSVTGAAGTTEQVAFEAPPPPAAVATGGETDAQGGEAGGEGGSAGEASTPASGGGGLSPIAFGIALVLTAGAGGTLAWSGVDTLDGVSAYNAAPTVEGLRDGQSRELRTNVLIGATGALAITTLVLAILTDWDGEGSSENAAPVQASFAIAPELAALQLSGSF